LMHASECLSGTCATVASMAPGSFWRATCFRCPLVMLFLPSASCRRRTEVRLPKRKHCSDQCIRGGGRQSRGSRRARECRALLGVLGCLVFSASGLQSHPAKLLYGRAAGALARQRSLGEVEARAKRARYGRFRSGVSFLEEDYSNHSHFNAVEAVLRAMRP